MPHPPWRNWYHCTVGTYASWLPGDPRGWRERDHHEHVDGDYKNPPPPTNFNAGRFQHSQKILTAEPYAIAPNDRDPIGRLLLENFAHNQTPILALAVCKNNFHALIQCADHNPKRILGLAKRHVTFSFSPIINEQTHERRQIWAGEGGIKPIRDREHAVNTFNYILAHINEGGWVWSFRDHLPKPAVCDGEGARGRLEI